MAVASAIAGIAGDINSGGGGKGLHPCDAEKPAKRGSEDTAPQEAGDNACQSLVPFVLCFNAIVVVHICDSSIAAVVGTSIACTINA